MKHLVTAGLFSAMIAAGSMMPINAFADETMDNATVQNRQMLMDGIGGAMGTLGCYLKGDCNLPDPVLRNLANGIAFAADAAPAAFEPKTMDATVKTTATDKVWSDWDDFAGRFPELKEAALAMAAAAGDKSAMGAAMGNLGKSCKGCHETYRSK
ncbi:MULTISPECIES: cytochrome c [Thalassospira]|jgi:cytochrome c556|uniref:Cytochrome C n=1 Tax=Thalassospira povalilytica TaxID=732237 RepID=A0A8I1SHQ2_9PROT|nr:MULTISPECIES: cytochrome c [Thalassospira]KZB69828.1 cytochrome C [Thalassospira sp. MCCC 1A02491]MEE3046225.1 cytochrome c [Pseudomonadota bacterium]RCK19290.1 cytochrome C [Thalassospira profundimaris]MAL41798.1 cytochrome C [Thalassospira sp.]MBN8196567.1 cytochrome c [Thalassospira povalilytica]